MTQTVVAYRSTSQVAFELGIHHSKLIGLIASRRLIPPGKNPAGDYTWFREDVQRAREALATVRKWTPKRRAAANA